MENIPLSTLWEGLEPGDWVLYTESGDARQRWILDSMLHTLAQRGYPLILLEREGICEKDPPGFLNIYRLNARQWDLPLLETLERVLREHASPAVILAEGLPEWLHEDPSRWTLVERLQQDTPALWIVTAQDRPGQLDPAWIFYPSARLILMPASRMPNRPLMVAWVRRAIGSLAPGFYRVHPPPAARLEPLFLSSQNLEVVNGQESHHQGESASINPPADPSPQKNRGPEQYLALIRQILTRAQETTDLSSFLNALIRELVERLGFDRGAITMLREGALEVIAEHRAHGGPSVLGERISLQDDPLSATIIATGRPLVLSDVRDGAPFGSSKPLIQRLRIRSMIIVPLIARGKVIGTIGLDAVKQPRSFDEAEVELIQTIAAAVAGFIERMQWLENAQRQARVLHTLHNILHEAITSTELRRFMEGALMHIRASLDLPSGMIWIGEQIVIHGINTEQLAFILEAAREARYRLHAVDPISDHAAMPPSPLRSALLQLGIRSTLAAPIYSEGQQVGVLAVGSPRPRLWFAEEITLLDMVAEEIGLAIARIQAFQNLRIFYALSDALSSLHNPGPALRNALEAFRAHLNASQICIYTPDPERSGQLIAWVGVGMPSPSPTGQARWEESIGIRQALQRGELWLEDCRAQFPEAPYQALALLPLQAEETFLGLLEIAWATPRVFDEPLRAMVKRAASILASGMLNIHLWKQLQERVRQLESLNEALKQALVAREQMIQNVSHELRTPLAIIQGYLELMDQEAFGPLTSDQRQALGVMRERLNVLIRYVELLLALQEIRAGARSLSFLDLRQLIQMACRAYQTRIDPQRHPLHVHTPDHPVWVLGESQLLLLAFSELLENAVKFSPHGGAIHVSLQMQGNEACLQVRDEGIGIPPEALPRVFEPFYQVNGSTTRKFGGMGIGLAAVKQIAETHGGRVEIQSELGRGTCVSLWLPIVHT